jgi:hypothetical protein
MQYNSNREPVLLKEYGRNIQNLVNYLKEVTDKDRRNELANQIVHIMRIINPSKDSLENQQRVWDQLFVMSGFELEVDAPFEKPKPEELSKAPDPLPYPKGTPKYKHFGRNLERTIAVACEIQDENQRKEAALYIAKMMKTFYNAWIKDLSSQSIAEIMFELSKGKLNLINEISQNPGLLSQSAPTHAFPSVPAQETTESRNRRKKRKKNKNKQNQNQQSPR